MSRETTTTTTMRFAPMYSLSTLRCGHLVLMVRAPERDNDDACPVCYAEARVKAERGADELLMMVRNLAGVERARAIARMDCYVSRHLAHAARAHSHQSYSVEHDLTDTQELPMLRTEEPR
jgi:hypothetical protein